MAAPMWIKRMLDNRGIAYREQHHRQAYTAQEVAQREHVSGHRVAKVVVAVADGKFVELILPASRRVQLDRVRDLLGAHDVRLATEAEIDRVFDDCERGAIPPLPHGDDIAVVMDGSMNVTGDILFQAGTHEDAVCLRFDDWFAMVHPRVESFSEPAVAQA
jgi:Ala-tRNA(Pro) deacylase